MRSEKIFMALNAAIIAFLLSVTYQALVEREKTPVQTVSPRFQLAEVEPCED